MVDDESARRQHFSEVDPAPTSGRRLFSRRSERRWRPLLEMVGRVDDFEVWDDDRDDDDAFRYHVAFLTHLSEAHE